MYDIKTLAIVAPSHGMTLVVAVARYVRIDSYVELG